jgi:hypothetical protein
MVVLLLAMIVGGLTVVLTVHLWAPADRPTRIDATGVQTADRFVSALLVQRDCSAAKKDAYPGVMVCSGKAVVDHYGFDDNQAPGLDTFLVGGSGAIVPYCEFKARYSAYGRDIGQAADNCVAFRTVWGHTTGVRQGSIAVYLGKRHGAWVVIQYDTVSELECGSECATLWARRVLRPPT